MPFPTDFSYYFGSAVSGCHNKGAVGMAGTFHVDTAGQREAGSRKCMLSSSELGKMWLMVSRSGVVVSITVLQVGDPWLEFQW